MTDFDLKMLRERLANGDPLNDAQVLFLFQEIATLNRHLAHAEKRRREDRKEQVSLKDLKAQVSGLLSQVADLDQERKSLRATKEGSLWHVMIRKEDDVCKHCGRLELQSAKDGFYSVDCLCQDSALTKEQP